MPEGRHQFAVFLFRKLSNRSFAPNGLVSGTLATDVDAAEVLALLAKYEMDEFSDAETRNIRFWKTNTGIFSSLDDLLESPERRMEPPAAFYLADIDFAWPSVESTAPDSVRRYLEACRLHRLMAAVADHKDGSGETLFFLKNQTEKLKIRVDYTADELQSLPNLSEFDTEFVSSKSHKQQKQTIVRNVLLEIFKGREAVRFGDLFGVFPDFLARIYANYAMYVAEFSFEKIRAEVDKDNLDSTIKLNKVFSDIQGQLLAIPIGLILIGGQMKDAGKPTLENFLIWGASLIFVVFMDLLIRNQRHSLDAVHKEIKNRQRQLQEKSSEISARFANDYAALDARHQNQKILIYVIDAVVALSFVCASYLMLRNSGCLAESSECVRQFLPL